jgi:hypothetical protein
MAGKCRCPPQRSRRAGARATLLRADGHTTGETVIRFDDDGYTVVKDTADRIRGRHVGYLHICEQSAPVVTDACRDQMIRYLFDHPPDLPGLGSTPQRRYFAGLSSADLERIGNGGKTAYYA